MLHIHYIYSYAYISTYIYTYIDIHPGDSLRKRSLSAQSLNFFRFLQRRVLAGVAARQPGVLLKRERSFLDLCEDTLGEPPFVVCSQILANFPTSPFLDICLNAAKHDLNWRYPKIQEPFSWAFYMWRRKQLPIPFETRQTRVTGDPQFDLR